MLWAVVEAGVEIGLRAGAGVESGSPWSGVASSRLEYAQRISFPGENAAAPHA